jgi:GNAT superfamily N-acetyltransferase
MTVISKGISINELNSIEEILRSTGFFYDFEIETALEIAVATISEGTEKSCYQWMKVSDSDGMVAFGNYARNSLSVHSWDLYWLAVRQMSRNKKIGTLLLEAIENDVRKSDGKILWIETSGRPLYESTESFYRRKGYSLCASLKDFYATGDPKQIYSKVL